MIPHTFRARLLPYFIAAQQPQWSLIGVYQCQWMPDLKIEEDFVDLDLK